MPSELRQFLAGKGTDSARLVSFYDPKITRSERETFLAAYPEIRTFLAEKAAKRAVRGTKTEQARAQRLAAEQENLQRQAFVAEKFRKDEIDHEAFRKGISEARQAAFMESDAVARFLRAYPEPTAAEIAKIKEPKERAVAQYYRALTDSSTLRIVDWDKFDEALGALRQTWTPEQREHVARNTGLRVADDPLVKELDAHRDKLETAGWYDWPKLIQAALDWAKLAPPQQKLLLAWAAERSRTGVAGRETFIQEYGAPPANVRLWLNWFDRQVDAQRDAMRRADSELDAGHALFYKVAPMSVTGLKRLVATGKDSIDRMIRSGGVPLSTRERDAIAGAGVKTIKELAQADPVDLARRTGLDPKFVAFIIGVATRAAQ